MYDKVDNNPTSMEKLSYLWFTYRKIILAEFKIYFSYEFTEFIMILAVTRQVGICFLLISNHYILSSSCCLPHFVVVRALFVVRTSVELMREIRKERNRPRITFHN